MIYFLILVGIILIIFSLNLSKKSKKNFNSFFQEKVESNNISVVNNTYEEIEMKNDIKKMQSQIELLMKNNEDILALQKQSVEMKRMISDLYNGLIDEKKELEKVAFEKKSNSNFLDKLVDETGVGKGDLLLLKKSL